MLVKYLFVAAAAVVGTVAAVKCDAQAQFDLCKQNMQTNVDACDPSDARCLCKAHKIILNNCYPLCPQDTGKGSQESMVSSWCVSAGGDKEPSSSVPVPVATTTTESTGSSTDAPAPSETTSTTSTSTDTPSGEDTNKTESTTSGSPTPTGNAGNMLAPAGFMVAAAAVAGLVL